MRTTLLIVGAVVIVAAIGVVAQQMTHEHGKGTAGCPMMTDLSAAAREIDEATAALNDGQKDQALASLKEAKALLINVQTTCQEHMAGGKCPMAGGKCPMMTDKAAANQFANVKCPIMGNPINPAKVPPALVREFNGQKVAFCCAGCPGQWDKLSDKEKQAKLDAVKAPAPTTEPADKVMKMEGGGCCK